MLILQWNIAHNSTGDYSLVNNGKDIFGDGNIECAVSMFKQGHNCNKYCKWSGFKLKVYEVAKRGTEIETDSAQDALE
jgi:hypothetical protein